MPVGTVGRPLPGIEARIADDGELLVRGPSIFAGYFKNDEATRRPLPDGWLATGDVATIDEDGYVRITGRKKDLIITSSGKNISPANIETALKQSRWISEARRLRRPAVLPRRGGHARPRGGAEAGRAAGHRAGHP